MKANSVTALIASAGVFVGALAWSFHQESAFIISSFVCGGESGIWIVGAGALLLLAGGAGLSWFTLRSFAPEPDIEANDGFRACRFLARVSVLLAAIFLFAVLMQGAAVLFLPACAA